MSMVVRHLFGGTAGVSIPMRWVGVLVALFVAGMAFVVTPAQAAFEAPSPVLITSIGQSPDAFTLSILSGRANVAFNHEDIAGPSMLPGNQSLLLAVGASQKGFGAAGITLESELARAQTLIEEAKTLYMTIIVAHIGGNDRRDPVTMRILDEILPSTDALIVYEGGNEDGFFTDAATKYGIPIVLLDNVLAAATVLTEVFSEVE